MRNLFHLARIILVILVFETISSCINKTVNQQITGVKIYSINKNIDTLITQWLNLGINTAFVSEEIAANITFRDKAKVNGIKVFIIEPLFFNPDILKQDSSLYAITNKGNLTKSDWVEFVCPSNKTYKNTVLQKLENDVSNLKPDGISLDFIRHFVYWEMVGPDQCADSIEHGCFCDRCVTDFSNEAGIALPDTFIDKAGRAMYILQHHKDEWTDWKCNLAPSFAKSCPAIVLIPPL